MQPKFVSQIFPFHLSRYFQSMSINGFALLVHFKVMHFQSIDIFCHFSPLIGYTSYISSHILAGAPGCINDSLLTGLQFVYGFESFFFVSRWAMHQLVIIDHVASKLHELINVCCCTVAIPYHLKIISASSLYVAG